MFQVDGSQGRGFRSVQTVLKKASTQRAAAWATVQAAETTAAAAWQATEAAAWTRYQSAVDEAYSTYQATEATAWATFERYSGSNGDISARGKGDSDVRRGQRRGIVDAIADHCNSPRYAARLRSLAQAIDEIHLVGRTLLRSGFVLRCWRRRRRRGSVRREA